MKKLLILAGVGLALLFASNSLAQFGGPNGSPGVYDFYDAGSTVFAAGDSLILPAPTNMRITFIHANAMGPNTATTGDSLTLRMLKREPYGGSDRKAPDGTTYAGGEIASTDEIFILSNSSSRTYTSLYVVCDTLILRGEASESVSWSWLVGYAPYARSRDVGSAP